MLAVSGEYKSKYKTLEETKFPQLLCYRETHTQRHKAANFIYFIYIFVAKIHQKVPHEYIHGEASILENFQKEN
jgi:hypothetical protein